MANTKVTYKNAAVKSCVEIWEEGRMPHMMAKEVATGSNDQALDILRADGFDGPFDDNGFTSLRAITDFYGVTDTYMLGILRRNHISFTSTPTDVVHHRGMGVELSARMALALSCVMYAGRGIPKDSKVAQVFQNLSGTSYYVHAKRAMDAKKLAGIMSDGNDQAEITEDGRVMVSLSGLVKLLALVEKASVAQ